MVEELRQMDLENSKMLLTGLVYDFKQDLIRKFDINLNQSEVRMKVDEIVNTDEFRSILEMKKKFLG